MSYEDKIPETDKEVKNDLIATKILDLMDKLRLDADDNPQRRWIWELLQNAKDVAFDNQQVEMEVNIQEQNGQKSVLFRHNGKPFSFKNITSLIIQTSTKERTANANNETLKTTGKFGTGFLTTHLLSEKVEVSGVVKEPDEDYRSFILPLDRSGRTPEEIIESVNKSMLVRDTLDTQPPLSNYNPKSFNTTFRYNLNDEGHEVAKVGIKDLHLSLPFTLAFLPIIKSVSIKHENITYELAEIENEGNNIQIATIIKRETSGAKEIKIVTLSKNTTTIAIEIERNNEKTYVKGFADDLPKLFCDFPLIGTNDFTLPIIINSSTFNPTEPRDGVYLTDKEEEKVIENKQIIQDSIELYFELLKYASENNWQHLFHLARTDMPEDKKWFSQSWFETNFQKPIRNKILITPIIDIADGRRVGIEIENGAYLDFPHHSKKDIREKIWELCNIGKYFILPRKDEVHEWCDVIWDNKYHLSLEVIIKWVAEQKKLETLKSELGKSNEEAIEWLNQFYELISLDDSATNLVNQDKYAVILNQNNIFQLKSKLSRDENIEEELKNALFILSKDWRDVLVHEKIKTSAKINYPSKTQDNIIDEINKIIKEGKINPISEACDYLSSCFAECEDFPIEQAKIYEYSQALWEMPEKRKIEIWSESIWQEVNKLQIKRLIQTISECKSIDKLQESLKLEKKDTLEWLSSFIEFLINNGYEDREDRLNRKTSPILPNQNGNFCIKDDLFLDNGEIDEILKDILESLGNELREELLDLSIYLELPKNRERNQEFVADEIYKLIKPKFAEVPRTDETKQIFKSLYLWFNKNKVVAENIFPTLYANKHKLYDDDDIKSSFEKAELLDKIYNGKAPDDILERIIEGNPDKIKNILDLLNDSKKEFTSENISQSLKEVNQRDEIIELHKDIYLDTSYTIKDSYISEDFPDGEKKDFGKKLLELLDKQDSQWKGYIYHFSHIMNIAKILKGEKIKSRYSTKNFFDSAGIEIIERSKNEIKNFARFYFRPKTPTQWHNEGLGQNILAGNPICPIPIFLKFNLSEVIERNPDRFYISNGNLSTSWAEHGNDYEFLKKFDYTNVYKEYPDPTYKQASQQEFIIGNEFDFSSFNDFSIICRTEHERSLLERIIDIKFASKIVVDSDFFWNNNALEIRKISYGLAILKNKAFKLEGKLNLNVILEDSEKFGISGNNELAIQTNNLRDYEVKYNDKLIYSTRL